jgi:hypothetical protein
VFPPPAKFFADAQLSVNFIVDVPGFNVNQVVLPTANIFQFEVHSHVPFPMLSTRVVVTLVLNQVVTTPLLLAVRVQLVRFNQLAEVMVIRSANVRVPPGAVTVMALAQDFPAVVRVLLPLHSYV